MIVTVDIGGTKIAAAALHDDGHLEEPISYPCPAAEGRHVILAAVRHAVARVIAAHGPTRGIAVATAGVVDPATGRIVFATANMAQWGGTHLAEELGEAFNVPVAVLGDGHAHGLGLWFEQAVSPASLIAVAVGTGIGGSIVFDGEPLLGSHLTAGHLGHVPVAEAEGLTCPCGAAGHLEAVASGPGILAWYHRHGGNMQLTSTASLDAATEDVLAGQALAVGGAALGAALAGLVNTLDPDVVVISGGVARAGARWRDPVRGAFRAGLMPSVSQTVLAFAEPDPCVPLRGAAVWALGRWNS